VARINTHTHTYSLHSVHVRISLWYIIPPSFFSFFPWKCVVVGFISIYKLYPFPTKHSQASPISERIRIYICSWYFYEYLLFPSASYAYMVCSFLGHQIISRFCISMLLLCNYTSWMNWKCFDVVDGPLLVPLSCFVKCSYNIFITSTHTHTQQPEPQTIDFIFISPVSILIPATSPPIRFATTGTANQPTILVLGI